MTKTLSVLFVGSLLSAGFLAEAKFSTRETASRTLFLIRARGLEVPRLHD